MQTILSDLNSDQRKVIENLQAVSGFNGFYPGAVIMALMKNPEVWIGGIYSPRRDDTLYLYPAPGKAKDLELIVWRHMRPDEVNWMPLYDYGKGNQHGEYPILAEDGLRVWWD